MADPLEPAWPDLLAARDRGQANADDVKARISAPISCLLHASILARMTTRRSQRTSHPDAVENLCAEVHALQEEVEELTKGSA
jgi:hypothetical protein